jgi:Domain of unknown function DUF29
MMDDPSDTAAKTRTGEHGVRARYEDDLYTWSTEQAALLRAGRVSEVDARNIAEELDDVGNEQYDKLESALRVILLHLLKWDHQPAHRSRSWRLTIWVQRKHVHKVLRKNPGLKPLVGEAIADAYDVARIEAAGETDLDEDTFPLTCPYSYDEIMERPISWPLER